MFGNLFAINDFNKFIEMEGVDITRLSTCNFILSIRIILMATTVGTCLLTWGLTQLSDLYLISLPVSFLSFAFAATECYYFADIHLDVDEAEDASELETKYAQIIQMYTVARYFHFWLAFTAMCLSQFA